MMNPGIVSYKEPLFSIIIAVFNNEKYLPKAIDSVLSQDFQNYEVIIVDDGSTDGTPQIADRYAAKYPRIRVIHQENQWIYASFNNGIEEAKGRYIYILNSDDQLSNGSLSTLAEKIDEYNYPEVVWTPVMLCDCDTEQNIIYEHPMGPDSIPELYCSTPDEVHKSWRLIYESELSVNQANLYSRRIALEHPFRNDVYGADTLFNLSIAEGLSNCLVISSFIYRFFVYNDGSNTSIGKYYEYEHRMFSDFFMSFRKLFESWDLWDEETARYYSNRRITQFIGELNNLHLSSCSLTNKEKIKRILKEYYDDLIVECVLLVDREEEIESRILYELNQYIWCEDVDDELWCIRDTVRIFLDLRLHTTKELTHDIDKIGVFLNHPWNQRKIGKILYRNILSNYTRENKMRRKALWLCNVVISEFTSAYGMKRVPHGGWISGMFGKINDNDNYEIAMVFPIHNIKRMRDGYSNGCYFFSFHDNTNDQYTISEEHVNRFKEILCSFNPDIVHIWGTEYPWALEMTQACEDMGIVKNEIVYIQGLISVYSRHYRADIPDEYYYMRGVDKKSIHENNEEFSLCGRNEITVIKNVNHIIGRTDWDLACVKAVNPKVMYYMVREILRKSFYSNVGTWTYDKMCKYSIFLSQAYYPIKGFHYLVSALPIIIDKYPDTHVYVGGENIIQANNTPYASFVKEQIEQKNLIKHITFLGKLTESEMIQQYKQANVFLSPSSIENSPNSISEAMMIGVPVVASFVGGLASIIDHNVNGYLYPEKEKELLAYYIITLFENRAICDYFSSNAVKKAKKYNSQDGGYQDLLSCYNEVIQHE